MPAAAQALWSAAQDALRGMLKTEIYSLWFAPIQPVSLKGETLTLGVADEFCEMWLKDNYLDLLRSVVSRAAVKPMALEFTVVAPLVATSPGTPAAPEAVEEPEPVEDAAPSAPTAPRPGEPLLNPGYTFSTFVVGNNNEFAHSASLRSPRTPARPSTRSSSSAASASGRPICSTPSATR